MRRRLLTGIAAAAVIVAVTGALVLQQSDSRTAPAAAPGSTAGRPLSATTSPQPPTTTRPSAAPAPAPAPAPKQGPPSATVPSPREPTDVREADPVAPDQGPGTLPGSKPLATLVTMPLPDTSSAVGSIVAGFPTRVIPEAPHSSVATSSVAAEGSRLQAALTAQTTLSVVEVMDFYRTALAGFGLFDTPAPALDGSSALAFTRGDNTVTLTATTIDGGCRYVVFGSFSA